MGIIYSVPLRPWLLTACWGGGYRTAGVHGPAQTQTYDYHLLKITTALWSDGRGDVIVEQNLENVDTFDWDEITWYFDWYPGQYANIRAWDDRGPLSYSTTQEESTIYVTVNFRNTVPIGSSYHFFMAITIAGMAYGSGNDWSANWFWSPGESVQEFIQGVTFPSNSTITSITPPPTSQNHNYLEWRETNTPVGWEQTISVDYTLSDTIGVPLF